MAARTQIPPPQQGGDGPATDGRADLERFLLARLDEDAVVAYARHEQDRWCSDDLAGARRLLLECDAKRRIVDDHRHRWTTTSDGASNYMDCDVCVEAGGYAKRGGWCLTLRALALPYRDHPEYDRQWHL